MHNSIDLILINSNKLTDWLKLKSIVQLLLFFVSNLFFKSDLGTLSDLLMEACFSPQDTFSCLPFDLRGSRLAVTSYASFKILSGMSGLL